MKKVFKVFIVTLGVILLLLIALPVIFRSKLEEAVKNKINQEIHATVDWTKFGLSFFRGFPDLSMSLHQVSVVGMAPFEGDTLVGLKRFELRVNPFSALKKELLVKTIRLDHPLVNGKVLEDGSMNWDVVQASSEDPSESPATEPSESSMSIALQNLIIHKGRIFYEDRASRTWATLEDFNLKLSGDFSKDLTQLDLRADVSKLNASQGGIRYLKDSQLAVDLLAEANMLENKYTLKENEIQLNGLVLGTEGFIYLLEEGAMDLDLSFFTRETSFQTLLSLIPAIYLNDFESIQSKGELILEGSVKGVMKDSLMPDAQLLLQVSDGFFAYPDLPRDVSDVQIKLAVDYKGKDLDASTVYMERLHMNLGGNPFDMSLFVDHPISDMHVVGEAIGKLDFASIKDVLPLEDINLQGILDVDLSLDTRMSFIEQEKFDEVDLDGSLLIEEVLIESAELPVPVQLSKMEMDFNPRYVELVSLALILGKSDLHLSGELSNFIPYLFDGQTLKGRLNLHSNMLDANELMPEVESEDPGEQAADSQAVLEPDSLSQGESVKIPENIQFGMTVQMDQVNYKEIEVEDLHGTMEIREGVAYLNDLSLQVIDGEVKTSGQVDTRGEFASTDVNIEMSGIDIKQAYETFVAVERLAPMAKYCRGSVNMSVTYSSLLDASLSPVYESIDARGKMFTNGLKIHDLSALGRLSEMLNYDNFKEIAPNEVEASFTVKEGRVMFQPFTMSFQESSIITSGSHGIDHTLDYLLDMKIAKSDLGTGANDMFKGLSLLAAGAGIRIPESDYVKVLAKISGTFDKPKVSTDLTGNLKSSGEAVSKAVQERVIEEVVKAEEQVREEASEEVNDLITEAEAEAERLIEEARKGGEALVREAEVQGENLIKEAGDSALKQLAAKRAAQELKKQAEKQSERLIVEAEEQAAELIKEARAQAEKI